jgi:transposase-like protein
MPAQRPRVFGREFKEAAVRRILAGEKVSALAAELQVCRKSLYDWWNLYERGGPEALRLPGRPRGSAAWDRPRVWTSRERSCADEPETTSSIRSVSMSRRANRSHPGTSWISSRSQCAVARPRSAGYVR